MNLRSCALARRRLPSAIWVTSAWLVYYQTLSAHSFSASRGVRRASFQATCARRPWWSRHVNVAQTFACQRGASNRNRRSNYSLFNQPQPVREPFSPESQSRGHRNGERGCAFAITRLGFSVPGEHAALRTRRRDPYSPEQHGSRRSIANQRPDDGHACVGVERFHQYRQAQPREQYADAPSDRGCGSAASGQRRIRSQRQCQRAQVRVVVGYQHHPGWIELALRRGVQAPVAVVGRNGFNKSGHVATHESRVGSHAGD